ncbi:ATP-binding protein [Dysosmobacter sp.]|uniref:ATP-binding protein n=1 Tax=Dysosmobacter sp. TaxID=2591382 RepID=UPI002A9EF818|nr:AAA family ATPase [Dysosmobacter sp.]MDY5611652.1 AAA family ATPase [Dysosmobacter sp.]
MYIGVILLLIRRMTASFGKLQGVTLELKDGLNILQAPNETGKSTWCAFLLSMFYGINSRERERAGFIPDKIRYAPWSGGAMSGRLDCMVDGQELTLTRTTRRQTAPMGEFQAVYTGTGDHVPELTGAACGETLLGVSREVYERSAFIRQAGLPISQDAGLERRIASLITSGEEDTSYSEAADTLKKQLNRRRHNKTGQLPALEAELQDTERQIAEAEVLARQLAEARAQAEAFARREAALSEELVRLDRWEAALQRQALAQASDAAQQAEQRAAALRQRLEEDRVPENETIGRLRGAIVNLETTRKAVDKARAERDEAAKVLLRAEAAVNESPFTGLTPEQAEKSPLDLPSKPRIPLWAILLLALCAAVLGAVLYLTLKTLPLSIGAACGLLGISVLVLGLFTGRKQARWETLAAEARQRRQADLAAYTTLYRSAEAARAEADKRSATAEALYNTLSSNEQGILLEIRRFAPSAFDVSTADSLLRECATRRKALAEAEAAAQKARLRYELLAQQTPAAESSSDPEPAPPARSREAVTGELAQVRADLAAARSAADCLSGQLHAKGAPAVLQSSAQHLREQVAALEGEYESIRMAMTALESANTTLQNRFSPALGHRAAEIFGELTGQRYSGVVLDRTFRISAEPSGDGIYRDAALLSAGTADQLYLAARLAICDLVLPQEQAAPIILDDALANFDDDRCAAALRWLKEEGKRRQILLFTCHSREAGFFAGDSEVSIQRLTETA